MPDSSSQSYWDRLARRPKKPSGGGTSLMVTQFRTFYAELSRLSDQVQSRTWEASGASAPERADEIQQHLLDVLDRQEQTIRQQGGERMQERHRRARYVMAALADELFLRLDWPGSDYWTDHLLESRLFDSQNAGEKVFTLIEGLLRETSGSEVDLATVYLYTLVLGFEGQYQDVSDRSPLDDYRRQLYQYITRREAERLEGDVPVSRDAYRHTLDQGSLQLLPDLRVWGLRMAIVLVLYLGVSTAIWWYYTGDLASLAEAILAG